MRLLFKFIYFALLSVALTHPAYAQVVGDNPAQDGLQWLIELLYGIGICIATLGLMGIGLLCKYHIMQWRHLGNFIIGCAMYFGASTFVALLVAVLKR